MKLRSPHMGFLARILQNEDWLAIFIALFLIVLSAVGVIGKNGIPIHF